MAILPETLLTIDGISRPAEGGRTYDNIGPWTGQPVGKAADASAADVEAAIASAREAFDETDWSTNRARRVELLEKLYELLVANRDRLVLMARHEVGAALGAVGRAQVDLAIGGFKDLLTLFPSITWEEDFGESGPPQYRSHRKAVYEPIGVVAAITPWNAPLYINVGKCVAALLAGCTVILKPAPDTPGMGTILGELAVEAGFPAGVFNVITGSDPALAGEMMMADRRVDLISFTGSTAIGRHIMEQCGKSLKRVFLELGGKSAKIVFEDVPNFAQEVSASMVVSQAGQGCAIMTRLLVPRSHYPQAVEALRASYAAYGDNWGDFDGERQMMGPLANAKQLERVKAHIDGAVAEGATLLVGGKVRPDKGTGYFIEPTCFVDVTNDMKIAQEEIFGPVLVVIPFEDEEDAIRIANDSEYGLSGGVFAGDLDRAMRVAGRIRTGSVMVNGGLCIAGDIPFGGYKASGIGREWGVAGIEEFLETKVLAWRIA